MEGVLSIMLEKLILEKSLRTKRDYISLLEKKKK